MSTIAVIGGTGYAGASIVAEAAARGHAVRSLSRSTPEPRDGVTAVTGSALDPTAVAQTIEGADAVVGALSPRGELAGHLLEAYRIVLDAATAARIPVVFVGGFGSLRVAPDGPRVFEGPDFPDEYRPESVEVAGLLPVLAESGLDWTYVSPAASYGAHNPGEAMGTYRLGGDVASFDEGPTSISGADFARGIVDIVEAGVGRGHVSLFA